MKTRQRGKKPKADPRTSCLEAEIIDALEDFADALEKGEVHQRLTVRQIHLNLEPGEYSRDLVKKTRELLGLSQPLFARFLGISAKTIRAWEQGVNAPHPMACRFMDEIRLNPDYWKRRLRQVTEPRAKF